MLSWIDGTLYPDEPPPTSIETLEEQIDFLARLCSAWDFGLLPTEETIAEVRRPAWREAVDETQLLTSIAYHLLRQWHGLPDLPYLGQTPAYVRDDPNLAYV
jgi:hypothetical protein